MRFWPCVLLLGCPPGDDKLTESDSKTTSVLCDPFDAGSGSTTTGDVPLSNFTCNGPAGTASDDCKELAFDFGTFPATASAFCFAFSDGTSSEVLDRSGSYSRVAPENTEVPLSVLTRYLDTSRNEVQSETYDISVTTELTETGGPVPPAIFATLYSRTGCNTASLTVRQIGTCYSGPLSDFSLDYPVSGGGNETVKASDSGTPIMSKINPAIQVGWELTVSRPGDGPVIVTKLFDSASAGTLCGTLSCSTSLTPKEFTLGPC